MTIRKTILLSVIAVAFAAPGLASATPNVYRAQGDGFGPFAQEHSHITKTRAEVVQELKIARQDGTLPTDAEMNRNYPVIDQAPGSGKTRADVQNELLTMTADEKDRMSELYRH
ncbi:MAG: DUF4148 domain-containing protein [Polaromonas sp.]